MKIFIKPLTIFFLSLSGMNSAQAHASLTIANPKANAVIKILPKFVYVEFNEDLITIGEKNPNQISVLNEKKLRVDSGDSLVGGARVSTQLKPGLVAGKYQVIYRVVSQDGHVVNGKINFIYKP